MPEGRFLLARIDVRHSAILTVQSIALPKNKKFSCFSQRRPKPRNFRGGLGVAKRSSLPAKYSGQRHRDRRRLPRRRVFAAATSAPDKRTTTRKRAKTPREIESSPAAGFAAFERG